MIKKLHYISGQEIRVGDLVTISNEKGIVVFVIPSNQYSANYSKEDWEYLKEWFGIETKKMGLIHQVEPDEDIEYIKRK